MAKKKATKSRKKVASKPGKQSGKPKKATGKQANLILQMVRILSDVLYWAKDGAPRFVEGQTLEDEYDPVFRKLVQMKLQEMGALSEGIDEELLKAAVRKVEETNANTGRGPVSFGSKAFTTSLEMGVSLLRVVRMCRDEKDFRGSMAEVCSIIVRMAKKSKVSCEDLLLTAAGIRLEAIAAFQTAEPQELHERGFLDCRDLSELFGVEYDALRKRLFRWMEGKTAGDDYIERKSRRKGEGNCIYRIKAIRPILEEMSKG